MAVIMTYVLSELNLHNCRDMLMTGGIQNSVIYLNLLLQSANACETKKPKLSIIASTTLNFTIVIIPLVLFV